MQMKLGVSRTVYGFSSRRQFFGLGRRACNILALAYVCVCVCVLHPVINCVAPICFFIFYFFPFWKEEEEEWGGVGLWLLPGGMEHTEGIEGRARPVPNVK
jgi:hypothetical protein